MEHWGAGEDSWRNLVVYETQCLSESMSEEREKAGVTKLLAVRVPHSSVCEKLSCFLMVNAEEESESPAVEMADT